MTRRGEPVPFAFLAEADRFRSNVAPPPRPRATTSQIIGRATVGLIVVGGLAGSLLFGMPALDAEQTGRAPQQETALVNEGR